MKKNSQELNEQMVGDILDIAYINSLPQPFFARTWNELWPVYDICVQTGLVRIDVCGLLEVKRISDILEFRDDSGKFHATEDFYLDGDRAMSAAELGSIKNAP